MSLFKHFLLTALVTFILLGCKTVDVDSQDKAQLRMQLGLSQLERRNYPLALKEFLAAEELDPKNPLIQNNLGLIYFLREKYDLSIKHFSKSFENDPKFTEGKNNLARVYVELKQFGAAEKLLRDVLADLTYPTPAKASMNYGLLEFNRNRFKEAKYHFKKVLEAYREDCYAQVFLGRSFMELKEIRSAMDQLEKAAVFCKAIGVDEGHYYSAIAIYRSGDKENSLTRFKELLVLFPEGKYREQTKQMIGLIDKGAL